MHPAAVNRRRAAQHSARMRAGGVSPSGRPSSGPTIVRTRAPAASRPRLASPSPVRAGLSRPRCRSRPTEPRTHAALLRECVRLRACVQACVKAFAQACVQTCEIAWCHVRARMTCAQGTRASSSRRTSRTSPPWRGSSGQARPPIPSAYASCLRKARQCGSGHCAGCAQREAKPTGTCHCSHCGRREPITAAAGGGSCGLGPGADVG